MSNDPANQMTEKNASRIDAWVDGYMAARDGEKRSAPGHFTNSAQAEWLSGWDYGLKVLNGLYWA